MLAQHARTAPMPHAPRALPHRRAVVEALTPDTVQRVYAALGVERFGPGGPDNWLVCSPLRPDRQPSFTIRKRDGVWRDNATNAAGSIFDAVMCVRGCDFRAALAEVAGNLPSPPGPLSQPWERGPGGEGTRAAQPTATYPYESADGTLLYEIVRLTPKDFRARRPARAGEPSKGGWVWSLADVPRVLYRLTELLGADEDAVIFIPEGEKDVDRLRALGLVATTNPGGAGKWHAAFSDALRDRHVAILPDNDEPGRKHAALIARALHGVARSVRVVQLPGLPPGGDVSDWLDAGGTAQQLQALAEAARPLVALEHDAPAAAHGPEAVVTRLADVQPRAVSWLWERWLPRGKLSLLGGHPGVGKSTLAAALAAAVSRGAAWPDGGQAPLGRVLFLLAEDAVDDTLRPRLDQLGADVTRIHSLDAVREADGAERMLNLAEHLPLLDQTIRRHNIDLVVIDPLSAFLPNRNRNDEGDIRDLLTPLGRLAEARDVALLGIMHVGKPAAARRTALQSLLGATAFGAFARSVLMCAAVPESEHNVLAVIKSNLARKPTALEWSRPEDGGLEWHGPTSCDMEALLGGIPGLGEPTSRVDAAETFLREQLAAGPRRVKELFEAADEEGIKRRSLRTAKESLELIVSKEAGVSHGGWLWSLPHAKVTLPQDTHNVTLASCRPDADSSGQGDDGKTVGQRHLDFAGSQGAQDDDAGILRERHLGQPSPAPAAPPALTICWLCAAPLATDAELADGMCAGCRGG